MSVYPKKSPTRTRYTSSIKPAFIEPKRQSSEEEITAIQHLRQATHSLVQELWEAGRDTDPTASFAEPIKTPFVDPVRELKQASKVSFTVTVRHVRAG